jgi:hypothetical protein
VKGVVFIASEAKDIEDDHSRGVCSDWLALNYVRENNSFKPAAPNTKARGPSIHRRALR